VNKGCLRPLAPLYMLALRVGLVSANPRLFQRITTILAYGRSRRPTRIPGKKMGDEIDMVIEQGE
jgi:hypothetical protein